MATVTNTDLHLAKPVPPVNKADAARDAVDEIFAEMGSVTKRPHPNSAVRTVRSRPACERGTRFQLEPRTSQRRREPQEPIHVHQVVRGLCVAPMLVGLTMLAMPALFSYSWSPLRDTEVGKSATSMMRTSNNVQTTPIQDMRVGERTAGTNPICEQVAGLTPNPETWRKLDLFMTKESGLGLWIELLRPLEWIEAVGAAEGETVYLDLAEFGAEGKANVTYLGPCPPVQPGNGPIVTGTFKHQADENTEVVDLRLDGQKEPTGVTSNHPYWSVDRQSFVEVGKLRQGEQVDTLEGTRRVVSITPIKYTDFLYNMETTEHVYRVGSLGTLVHNSCVEIALGLSRHPSHTGGGLLQRFAGKVKGSWWMKWYDDGIISQRSWSRFANVFDEAATNTRRIHFNLDGVDDLASAYRRGGVDNAFSQIDNVTNAEFRRILDNEAFRAKTIFYGADGRIIPLEEILKAVGL